MLGGRDWGKHTARAGAWTRRSHAVAGRAAKHNRPDALQDALKDVPQHTAAAGTHIEEHIAWLGAAPLAAAADLCALGVCELAYGSILVVGLGVALVARRRRGLAALEGALLAEAAEALWADAEAVEPGADAAGVGGRLWCDV